VYASVTVMNQRLSCTVLGLTSCDVHAAAMERFDGLCSIVVIARAGAV
jgi:hypothetical protein